MEPVWFSPSALGQELAALPVRVPSDFKELWLAVTMGERAGFGLARGCSSGSAQVSHGLPATHYHADLPCCVWAVDLLGMRGTGEWRRQDSRLLGLGWKRCSCGPHGLRLSSLAGPRSSGFSAQGWAAVVLPQCDLGTKAGPGCSPLSSSLYFAQGHPSGQRQ